MRESFDLFWESETAVEIGHLRDVAPLIVDEDNYSLSEFEVEERLRPMLNDIENQQMMHSLFVQTAHHVDSIHYFYDVPHGSESGEMLHAASARISNLEIAGLQQ